MVDPSILSTAVHKMIKEEFEAAIYAVPTYACNISWKSKYKVFVNSIQKTMTSLTNCNTKKSKLICTACHNSMLNYSLKSTAVQAKVNNLSLCQKNNELEILCLIKVMLIRKIIPYMVIVA